MKVTPIALLSLLLLTALKPIDSPKAIIVVLKSERNKTRHFERMGAYEKAESIRQDVAALINVTINDFDDHFSFCPVYYCMDTNMYLIKERKFAGILLDKHQRIISPIPLDSDDLFLVVYYGTPGNRQITGKEATASIGKYYPKEGLVVLGPDLCRIRNFPDIIFRAEKDKKPSPRYNFTSQTSGLVYEELAGRFETRLKHRVDKYRW